MPEYRSAFPPVYVTVDVVLLTIKDDQLQVLMVKRGSMPWRGWWALPGGFIRQEEDLITAARRELTEETGLTVEPSHLEQVATFGAPKRDPRARTVSVGYLGILPELPQPVAGTDAAFAAWQPVDRMISRRLPFDHHTILEAGVERARNKLEYTNLATAFVGEEFTIGELRRVYEIIWGRRLDPGNFQRKVQSVQGLLQPVGPPRSLERGRPARIYRRGAAAALNPPMMR
jgi:8-oxo-dGTP diphosphatase